MKFVTLYEHEISRLVEARKGGPPNIMSPAVIGGAAAAGHELFKQNALGAKRAWGGIGPKRSIGQRFAKMELPTDTKKKVERSAALRRMGNSLRRYRGIPQKDDINIGAETLKRVQNNAGSALTGTKLGWEKTKRKAATGAVIGGTVGGGLDWALRR